MDANFYKDRFPYDASLMEANKTRTFSTRPCTPDGPGDFISITMNWYGNNVVNVNEFTGWRDEALSYHLTCSLSDGLFGMPARMLKGPDAVRFLKKTLINNMDRFPVMSSKHGVICTPEGYVASDGVIFRLAEDEFYISSLSPYLDYWFYQGQYDAVLEDISNSEFVLQLQGPKSLQVVEELVQEDLHDLGFCRLRNCKVASARSTACVALATSRI